MLSQFLLLLSLGSSQDRREFYVSSEFIGTERRTLASAKPEDRARQATALGFQREDFRDVTLWVKGDPFRIRRIEVVLKWIESAGKTVGKGGALVPVEVSEKPEDDLLAQIMEGILLLGPGQLVRPQKGEVGLGLSASNEFVSGERKEQYLHSWPITSPKPFTWTRKTVDLSNKIGFHSFHLGAILSPKAEHVLWQSIWRKKSEDLDVLQARLADHVLQLERKLLEASPGDYRTWYETTPTENSTLSPEELEWYSSSYAFFGMRSSEEAMQFLAMAKHARSFRSISIQAEKIEPDGIPTLSLTNLRSLLLSQ
ncbi:MAG: hypothetical protein MUC92_07400 [Fimbriimonadaceae bacterium]|jgi:hypothetical protein|nr:hypothetical protein [Fimbriimonadaceae bacterium]